MFLLDILQSVEYIYAYMLYKAILLSLLTLLPATCCLLPPTTVFAEDTLILKQIIGEAKENNPGIKALRQNVKAKEARARAEG
ncbi:MAG: hypothetical protein AABZ07_00460, partial [Nitrospirota bacterium]